MVKILGIRIGEKAKAEEPKACKHPIFQQAMRLNPDKQEMEIYCKKCGQVVEQKQKQG